MSRAGIVLCGGLSTRMGRAKARLPWRGRTLAEHVAATLAAAVDEVVVVASEELDLPRLDARVVRDREPRRGPLAGIRDGLAAIDAELAFVTATDAPFLTPDFVRALLAYGGAAAPEIDGFVQPLCAAYPRVGARLADELLASGRERPLHLLEACAFRRVAAQELPDRGALRNLNRPEDYLAALADDGAAAPVVVELTGRARLRGGALIETRHGRLADVLAAVQTQVAEPPLVADGAVSPHVLVAIDGEGFVRDGAIPVGPGDRLLVMDVAVGG